MHFAAASTRALFAALALMPIISLTQSHAPDEVGQHVKQGHLASRATLTLDGAHAVLAAATAEAKRLGVAGSYAVVDAGGHLVALERLDGSAAATPPIAVAKARTAALFLKPTSFFENVVNEGRTAMVTVPDFVPLQGGVPIVVGGEVVGAIGVSGASSAKQDEELAALGARAFVSNS